MILQTDLVDGSGNLYNRYSSTGPRRQRSPIKPAHKSLLIWHLVAVAYYLSGYMVECGQSGRIVDLTHTFDNSTIYWITEPTLTLNVTYNGTLPGKDYWYQKDVISAATHGGTHLDAPSHFAKGGWSVSDIPLERLVAPAVVIDISSHVGENPDVHLALDHVLQWESVHGPIPNGSLLLVSTGWSRFWPDKLKYTGTEGRDATQLKFPSIETEVAEFLVGKRNVVGVGIDTMSLDAPNATRPNVHVTLSERNIYGLENVNGLELLPPIGAVVYVMPMKLRYASGAPCRIVAQISDVSSGFYWRMSPNNMVALLCVILTFVVARM